MPFILRSDACSYQSLMRVFVLRPGQGMVKKNRRKITECCHCWPWDKDLILHRCVITVSNKRKRGRCADMSALCLSICAPHLIQQQRGSFPLNRGCSEIFKCAQPTDTTQRGFGFHLASAKTSPADTRCTNPNHHLWKAALLLNYTSPHSNEPSHPPSFSAFIPSLVLAGSA